MSVIIIGGGDGHNAITKLVVAYPHLSADEKAHALQLLKSLVEDVADLLGES